MKKIIVTTTINAMTPAIEQFQTMSGWDLVVIGDKKTPAYSLTKGTYLSPEVQQDLYPALSDAIGWNCIQRRNIGLLYAYQQGADIVAVVDDDNIPLDHWGQDLLLGKSNAVNYYTTDCEAFDPVGATNAHPIWHRGYPLQLLAKRNYDVVEEKTLQADVQADLWHGDPDTDAICRLIYAPYCHIEADPFPLMSNKPAPFNSQNTFLTREWIKHYFMFTGVGRMDDIWAAYYLQACGAKVVFNKPSVTHARNDHDITKDMTLEYLGYEKNLALIEALADSPDRIMEFLPESCQKAFELYRGSF